MKTLFVSDAHKRTIHYRTGSLYRGTFKAFLFTVAFVLIAAACYVGLSAIGQKLSTTAQQNKGESAAIAEEEAKIAPLIRRIAAVSEWRQVIEQRKAATDILAKIEASMTTDVCLQTIQLRNPAEKAKAQEFQTIRINGWAKNPNALGDLTKNLTNQLPGFTVKKTTPEKAGDGTDVAVVQEAGTEQFNVIITQGSL